MYDIIEGGKLVVDIWLLLFVVKDVAQLGLPI